MLKLTKTGIGLLTRQYRSVLKKCWLINVGAWLFGAIGKTATMLLPQTLRGTLSIFVEKIEKVLANLLKCNFLNDTNILKLIDIKLTQSETAENGANTFGKMTNVPSAEPLTSPSEGISFAINAKEVLDSLLQTNSFCIKKKKLIISTALVTSLAFVCALMSPSAAVADSLTAQEILNYLGTVSNGVATGTTGHTTWTNSGAANATTTYDTETDTATGTIKIGDDFFTYTYTKPSNYTRTSAKVTTVTADNVKDKTFYNSPYGISGGAIDYSGSSSIDIIADFISNSITGKSTYNSATYSGGAIYNHSETEIANITGDFIGNRISGENNGVGDTRVTVTGGAISNGGTIGNITSDFINNYVYGYASAAAVYGGAIYNAGTITSITGNFIGNSAKARYGSYGSGGAIYNTGTITSITGDFIDNSGGGAIYNAGGSLSLLAKDKNIKFYNNGNDIRLYSGTINLDAASDKSISFGGTIDGSYGTLNLNTNTDSGYHGGSYNFYNMISSITFNMGSSSQREAFTVKLGSIKQSDGSTTYGSLNNVNLVNNATNAVLDSINGHVDTNALNTLNLQQALKLNIDVDAISSNGDKMTLTNSTINGTGNFVIDKINVLPQKYGISVADDNVKGRVELSEALQNGDFSGVIGADVKSVEYDSKTGMLYLEVPFGSSGGTWGSITGTITKQTDLMEHLNNNYYRKNKKSEILGRFEGWKKTRFNTLSQNSAKNMHKHSCQFSHNRKAG